MYISNTYISNTILACGVRVVERKHTSSCASLRESIRVYCLLLSYEMYAEIATDTSQQTLYCPPGLKNTAFSFSSITAFSFSSIKCTIDLLHLLPLPNHFTWYPGQE